MIPGLKNNRLPKKQKQSIQLEQSTIIQIDMIKIENNFDQFKNNIQKMYQDKTNLKKINIVFDKFQLHFASHNSWVVIGNQWKICKLRNQKVGFLNGPSSRMKLDCIFDIYGCCPIVILYCFIKIEIRSQNIKKDQIQSYPLCWFSLPLNLWKQQDVIQINSMNENILNSNFKLKKSIKLNCRISHNNFKKYKRTKESLQDAKEITKIFQKEQKIKSQWKILKNHETPQSNMQQILQQTKMMQKQKQKIEKLLNNKLWKDKLHPSGINKFHPLQFPLIQQINIVNFINKTLSINIKIDSYIPYFKNLINDHTSYFVPRKWKFLIYFYDKSYISDELVLPQKIIFGYPFLFTKNNFLAGQSIKSSQIFKFQFDFNQNKEYLTKLFNNQLIIYAFDNQNHIVYGKGNILTKYFLNKRQQNYHLRSSIQIRQNNNYQIRGSISLDFQIKINNKQINKTSSIRQLPLQTITSQLSENIRISERINRYKTMKKQIIISKEEDIKNKQIQLQLIKKYKDDKIRKYARNIAQTYHNKEFKIIECTVCFPQFYIWEYTNNQNSVNNDYKIQIEDSDHSILQIQQLTVIQTIEQYKQACNILGSKFQNFKQINYKNEFYLKSGQKAKIILKYLTYRSINSNRLIQPHPIIVKLLRNTILTETLQFQVIPQPMKIDEVVIFYSVLDNVLELSMSEQFSKKYLTNYILPIYHNSIAKWDHNILKISLHVQQIGKKQFLVVVYKDKSRLQVLTVYKVIVYVYEGVKRTLKLGEILNLSLKLQTSKTKIARLDSSHPNFVFFKNNIVTVTQYQYAYDFQIFVQQKEFLNIIITAVDYDTNQLLYTYIVQITVIKHPNTQQCIYKYAPFSILKDRLTFKNNMAAESIFLVLTTTKSIIIMQNQLQVQGYGQGEIKFSIQNLEQFREAYIFVYNDSNFLIKVFEIKILRQEIQQKQNQI